MNFLRSTLPRRRVAAPIGAAAMVLALGVTVAACGGDDSEGSGDGSGGSIDLVAYSTPQQAFEEGIIPAFQENVRG